MDTRELDIVLWGATGFVGRRVAHHFAQRLVEGATFTFALGGRSREVAGVECQAHAEAKVVDEAVHRLVVRSAVVELAEDER